MKPNFETMSTKELRAYILTHREDTEALNALFNRRSPDSEAVWFHPPQSSEEHQQQFELFKTIVSQKQPNKNS